MTGLSLIMIFIAGMGGYALSNSTWFNLREIVIEGNQVILADDLKTLSSVRMGTNILKLSPKNIAENVSGHPFVKTAVVKRLFPNRLRLIITERSPLIIAQNADMYLAIDEVGYCLESLSMMGADKTKLPRVLAGEDILLLKPGDQTKDPGVLAALALIKQLDPFFMENIREFQAMTAWDLTLITRDGLPVYFGPPDKLAEKLQYYEEILVKNSVECNGNTLEYVDLRYDSQPVIKRK
jgi:cell division protein FtsQ